MNGREVQAFKLCSESHDKLSVSVKLLSVIFGDNNEICGFLATRQASNDSPAGFGEIRVAKSDVTKRYTSDLMYSSTYIIHGCHTGDNVNRKTSEGTAHIHEEEWCQRLLYLFFWFRCFRSPSGPTWYYKSVDVVDT